MVRRPTLDDVMAARGFTNADVASLATVSVRTVDRARAGEKVNGSSGKRMAEALDIAYPGEWGAIQRTSLRAWTAARRAARVA